RELSALYIFEAVVTAGLALLASNFSLPLVLVLAALDGTASLAASALLRTALARAAREEMASQRALGHAALTAVATEPQQAAQEQADRDAEAEREANAALNVCFTITFVLGPA